jgi:hypothetical protein
MTRLGCKLSGREVAESLTGLQKLLSGVEELAARAEVENRVRQMPKPPVINALHLVDGACHPLFRLDDTRESAVSFTKSKLRRNVLEELRGLLDLDGQAEAEDEDQDSPPELLEHLGSYALGHARQGYNRVMQTYYSQRRMRPGIKRARH